MLAQVGDGWEEAMRLALLVRDGTVPDRAHRLETDWVDPNTPTPLQTAQAVTLQINQGMISPTSPTALKKVGWTAVERLRIAQELKDNPVSAELAGLVNSEGDKLIVGGTRLEKAADFASLNAGIAATNPPAPASPAAPAE